MAAPNVLAQSVLAQKDHHTEDEYFAFDETSFGRWEYVDGVIRAMAGGTDDHNEICTNVVIALGPQMRARGCHTYGSDMRVHTGTGINTFPDVTVVCGPREYYKLRRDTITNPILIVEVLSESTQAYDLGDKFDHYKSIATLVDYLLIDTRKPHARLYTRDGDHWAYRDAVGLDGVVNLPSVDTGLALSAVYAMIEFDPGYRAAGSPDPEPETRNS
jgi:Uma2 family endonuclease